MNQTVIMFRIQFHNPKKMVQDSKGRDRFTTSNSGGALPSNRFGTSLSRKTFLLFHLPTWKREAIDKSKIAAAVNVMQTCQML